MAQTSGRPCPACGTMVPAGQRFCTNCGADIASAQPVSQYGGSAQQQASMHQVPPYAQAPNVQQQFNPSLYQQQQQQQQTNPLAEVLGALGLLFFMRRYRPGYEALRQRHGACGCLFMIMVLLVVVGIIGFFVYAMQSSQSVPRQHNSIQQPVNSGLYAYVQKSSAVATSISAQRSTCVISDHSTMACAPSPPGPKITVGIPAAERSAESIQPNILPSGIS